MARWVFLMLLFLPSVAHASIGNPVIEGSCPVCGGKVGWALSDAHPVLWIPLERDLRGPEYIRSFVTCEKCLYSGTPAEFETSLTPELLRKFQLSSMNLPVTRSFQRKGTGKSTSLERLVEFEEIVHKNRPSSR